jgi:hypothetical protein
MRLFLVLINRRYLFSNAGQLTTSVMGAGAACSASVFTRKRWPSGETS